MAIPTSKPLSLSTVQTEYGGSNPISMSEYRGKGNAPATGAIDLWGDFNGTSSLVTVTGFVYHDTWNNDTPTGTSVNLASKLNNQSTASFEQRQGEFTGGDYAYGHNDAYATGIGSILAIRKCIAYGSYEYDAGTTYDWASSSTIVNPSGNDSAYGRNNEEMSAFSVSKNILTLYGATECANWIKDGMYMRHTWNLGDSVFNNQNGAKLHYWYVDIDFDYTPA